MQWVFPSEEIYKEILQKTGYFQRDYFELKKEYKNLVFTFNADTSSEPKRNPKRWILEMKNNFLTNVWYYNNKQEMTLSIQLLNLLI